MMNPIYIHGIGTVSIQPHESHGELKVVQTYAENPVSASAPDYKSVIPALQLRRMNKSMRMALYSAKMAMKEAGIELVDAVIAGSGLGCLTDSERFVQAMNENNEQFLNPTSFIQSTHNMAAATIALATGCKGYNMTYVNDSTSFESAISDSMLYLQEHPNQVVLLGGVDELGERTPVFWELTGYLKKDDAEIPTKLGITATTGEVAAEGAAFFVVSSAPDTEAIAKITAVETRQQVADITDFVCQFLNGQNLKAEDIDVVMCGRNGDSRFDGLYDNLTRELFFDRTQCIYKPVLGEYDTVSASGLAVAARMLSQQSIEPVWAFNDVPAGKLNRVLLYNQRRGNNHSVVLLEKV